MSTPQIQDFRRLSQAEQEHYIAGADLPDKWTPHMRKKYLGEPDIIDYRQYHTKHFYLRSRVEAALPVLDEYLAERKAKRTAAAEELIARRARARAKMHMEFRRLYPAWPDALPDACAYLFDLNRYAKHESCSSFERDAIYELKNDLIRVLYMAGYSTECYLHTSELPEQECFGCAGTGTWTGWRTGDSDVCRKCNGTGVYRPSKTLQFVCFRFVVGDTPYCWHQPGSLVHFSFAVTSGEKHFDLAAEEKPVALASKKFAEAKAFIGWVMDRADHQEAVAA
jgi:hypothetical protein